MALPPDPGYGGPAALRWMDVAKSDGAHLPVRLRNLVRFTGDTLYPHHDNPQNLFPLRLTAVARRGRRCGLPLNQAAHNGAGQPAQEPRRTIGKRRRGKTVAETSRFLTTQGLGGPEGKAAESDSARRTQDICPQSDAPGSGPAGPGNFGYFPSLESSSPGGEISPSHRPARRR